MHSFNNRWLTVHKLVVLETRTRIIFFLFRSFKYVIAWYITLYNYVDLCMYFISVSKNAVHEQNNVPITNVEIFFSEYFIPKYTLCM